MSIDTADRVQVCDRPGMRLCGWLVIGLGIVALSCLAAGCESRVSLGERCSSASDCLLDVCGVGGLCRTGCSTSAECGGGRCLRDPVTGVAGCSLEADQCAAGTCADGLRCVDGACLGVCVQPLDCPDGVCLDDVCVVPAAGPDASVDASVEAGPDAPLDARGEVCPPGGVRDVDVGRFATCAIRCDGRVLCWGGWGLATSRLSATPDDCAGAPCLARPVAISLPERSWAQVAVGNERACALSSDGEVWCWGSITDTPIDAPVRIMLEGGGALVASEVRAGGAHACARDRAAPTVTYCWGGNESGQLGNGGTANVAAATPGFVDVERLAPGESRTHVLRVDGRVVGAGLDDDGEIVWPPDASHETAIEGPTLPFDVVDVVALIDQTCAVGADGELACWGRVASLFGRAEPSGAGDCGANRCVTAPVVLTRGRIPSGPLDGIAGDRFGRELLAWDAAGRLYGVGAGASVIGPEAEYFEATVVAAPEGMTTHHVRVGAGTACAILDADRSLVCWGGNDVGQLGRGAPGAPDLTARAPAWPAP